MTMVKRFTDTEKFRDSWYRKLSPIQKCVWEYALSECNHAGFFEFDIDSIAFHIGCKSEEIDISHFKGRFIFIRPDLVFIPKFIVFQQGVLNPENNAHKGIIKLLEKHNISIQSIYEFPDGSSQEKIDPLSSPIRGLNEEHASPSLAPDKPLTRGISKGKGKSNGNCNLERGAGENLFNPPNAEKSDFEEKFETFWSHYTPIKCDGKFVQKGSRADVREKFIRLLKQGESFEKIMEGLRAYLTHCRENNILSCQASVFLNKKRWEDDYGDSVCAVQTQGNSQKLSVFEQNKAAMEGW